MSNNDWQQAPDPHAQPPEYQAGSSYQAPQLGNPMNQPGSLPPEKKSKTGLWIGLGCGALLILLLIAGGVLAYVLLNGKDEGAPDSKDDTTTSAPAPAPKPKNPASDGGDEPAPQPDPNNPAGGGGNVPAPQPDPNNPAGGGTNPHAENFPQQIGDTTLNPAIEPSGLGDEEATYISQDMQKVFIVALINDESQQQIMMDMLSGEKSTVGDWQCAVTEYGMTYCAKKNAGGALVYIIGTVSGNSLSAEDVAAWGDELIAAKK